MPAKRQTVAREVGKLAGQKIFWPKLGNSHIEAFSSHRSDFGKNERKQCEATESEDGKTEGILGT
jgi:hypothetical protein